MAPVEAAQHIEQERREGSPATLGDVLYGAKPKSLVSEEDWVKLVQSIAAGDQLALHALYERTHRVVFILIVQITSSRETAEELTLEVFYDVWRQAARYDAENGTVLGWIMNQARSKAIDRLCLEQRKKCVGPQAGLVAFFSELPLAEVAARLNQSLGTVKARIRSGLHKLRQALVAEVKKP